MRYQKISPLVLSLLLLFSTYIFSITKDELYIQLGECIADLEDNPVSTCDKLKLLSEQTKNNRALLYYGHALMLLNKKKLGKKAIQTAILNNNSLIHDEIFSEYYSKYQQSLVKYLYFLGIMAIRNKRNKTAFEFWNKALAIAPNKKWYNKILEIYLKRKIDSNRNVKSKITKSKIHTQKYSGRYITLNTVRTDGDDIVKFLLFSKRNQKITVLLFDMSQQKVASLLTNEFISKNRVKTFSWLGNDKDGKKVDRGTYTIGIVVDYNGKKSIEDSIMLDY